MATGNLFLVTQTLQQLLRLNIQALLGRAGLPPIVHVTAMPPERVGSAVHTLNLHLYHLNEADHSTNRPPPPGAHTPVSRRPLALRLHYVMTAHHEVSDALDAEVQQRYLGLGMKTFHDVARIDDALAISPDGGPPQTVMSPDLYGDGNHLEIALRPVTAEESFAFWSSQQTSTARLAAYYEVRTVFL